MIRQVRLPLAVVVLIVAGAASAFARQATEMLNGREVSSNEVIIRGLTNNADDLLPLRRALPAGESIEILNQQLGLYIVRSPNRRVVALLTALASRSDISYAEPNYRVRANTTPNDPDFSQLWGMQKIGAPDAWRYSTGGRSAVAAIVDTGISYAHPDLAANVWSAPAAFVINVNGIQVSCAAGSHGFNAITKTCDPADDNGHGTHVAGTLGAAGNNGLGVAGVNWTASLMALKFLDASGSGSVSNAIRAIEFAIQVKRHFAGTATPVNIRVLSNSWSGSGFSQALLDEINSAGANDMLFVASAGNSSSSDDVVKTYPASYSSATLITVAATDSNDSLASFSNYGPATVHLAAPGVGTVSTYLGNGYANLSGTSMATPHVSGSAMLVLSACPSLNTIALRDALLTTVDILPSLSSITVTGGRLNVSRAISSCAVLPPPGPPAPTATFLSIDTVTQGSWKGKYGTEGYSIAGDATQNPVYVAPSSNGLQYTWASSTADLRALQKAASSDRVATTWYDAPGFTIDLNFTDETAHQVAIYCVDWDSYGPRSQKIEILDSVGNVLDTRSVSNFAGGEYLVWNLAGRVRIRATALTTNAVIEGVFFGGNPGVPSSATFVSVDTSTQGNWKGRYGAEGYSVVGDSTLNPAYVTPSSNGQLYTWASSTADVRALQRAASSDRIAATWYGAPGFTIDLNFTDQAAHRLAIYCVDWDSYGPRSQTIEILDGAGNVLDTRAVSSFFGGEYLIWNVSGHVKIRATALTTNAVIEGIFFGGNPAVPSSATFLNIDTVTQGSWKGVYGTEGYRIVGDAVHDPAYVTPVSDGAQYIWTSSTTDGRGLQKATGSDRIAATWYAAPAFTIDLNFSDQNAHQVAIYCMDWDSYGPRSQLIEILDVAGNVLDTRLVSNFAGGQYLVWNVAGHVRIRATALTTNAVIEGIFFR